MRIRLSQRRNKIIAAKQRAQRQIVAAILPVMQARFRELKRELREGGSLRKQLKHFYKQDGTPVQGNPPTNPPRTPPAHNMDDWQKWRDALIAALLAALLAGALDLGETENDVWTSRGFDAVDFDPNQVISDYQNRIGRKISNIADDTMSGVQAAIASWYMSDRDFPDLLDELSQWFDTGRAERIARNEVGNLNSQMALEFMDAHGVNEWIWDAMGENPCSQDLIVGGQTYGGCEDLNGRKFKPGDPMPPDAAHPNCMCVPTFIVEGK